MQFKGLSYVDSHKRFQSISKRANVSDLSEDSKKTVLILKAALLDVLKKCKIN